MRKVLVFIAALLILLIPTKTFAQTEQASFYIPESDYQTLLLFYTPEYISTMTYDEYMSFRSLDINPENVVRISKYYKVVTNNLTKEVDKQEISEEEYEAYDVTNQNRSYYFETAYQKMVLSFTHTSDTANFFSYTGIWKTMPSVRSYDDIGARIIGFSIVNGTQSTKQIYKLNGTTYTINYPYNGTYTKNFSNGYGVSMGLIGSNVTALQCTTSAAMTVNFYPAFIYGAYEHAIDKITLSKAKDYTLGYGAGDVFVWGSTASGHYDNMNGISTYITS